MRSALADRYRIERELGQGGMATVYLAQDLKHDRKVAIKVLRPELAAVIGAERFLSEIKTTANLQHPEILPLHDSGQADSFLFYVMPYVEGESLRERLNREKQLPIADAVRIATEVAGALDYAHRHGVIHRDIKPENILLHDGRALVADFGIALALTSAGSRMTETGMSLGTPHYMSPEQAMGDRELTPRSDVYALGAMTYEMLLGEPPFTGPTAQSIVAKVMTERPAPLLPRRDRIPPQVEDAVLTALEKLPADRWGTAKEFAEAIQGGSLRPSRADPRRRPRRPRDPLRLGLAVALVVAAGFAAWQWRAARRTLPEVVLRIPIELPRHASSGLPIGSGVAISRAGHAVAYIAGSSDGASQQILIRATDDLKPRAIPGTERAQSVAFSPDGRWLVFISVGSLNKVAGDGGAPVPLADMPRFRGASWSPKFGIIASDGVGLVTIPEAGGSPRPLSLPDTTRGEHGQVYPLVLADGEKALYASIGDGSPGSRKIGVLSLATGKTARLDVSGTYPFGVVDGFLVYATETGDIMAVRFDVRRSRVYGAPVKVAEGVSSTGTGDVMGALSESGALVGQFGSGAGEVVLVDRGGEVRPLIPDPRAYSSPRFSPDGRRIALAIGQASRRDVWIYELGSQTLTRLTSGGRSNDRPEWSSDGTRVLYRTSGEAGAAEDESEIWWRRADLGEPAKPLYQQDPTSRQPGTRRVDVWEAVMTHDGRGLVAQIDSHQGMGADVVHRMLPDDTTTTVISATPAEENQARPSPDGRWVAFRSDASGINQVLVRPLPGPGGQVVVSTTFGSDPVWSRDGRHLYYRDGQKLIEATVAPSSGFSVVSRTPLFEDTFLFAPAPHANYDVAPDGGHFVAIRPAEPPQLVLVHNWRAELRRRMNEVRP